MALFNEASCLCTPIKSSGRTKSIGVRILWGRGSSSSIHLSVASQMRVFHYTAVTHLKNQEKGNLAQLVSVMPTQ